MAPSSRAAACSPTRLASSSSWARSPEHDDGPGPPEAAISRATWLARAWSAAVDGHGRPLGRQGPGDGRADAAAAAGDQGPPAAELQVPMGQSLSGGAAGVSRLHGSLVHALFARLWPFLNPARRGVYKRLTCRRREFLNLGFSD